MHWQAITRDLDKSNFYQKHDNFSLKIILRLWAYFSKLTQESWSTETTCKLNLNSSNSIVVHVSDSSCTSTDCPNEAYWTSSVSSGKSTDESWTTTRGHQELQSGTGSHGNLQCALHYIYNLYRVGKTRGLNTKDMGSNPAWVTVGGVIRLLKVAQTTARYMTSISPTEARLKVVKRK